jgi:hypothetical protein
LFLINSDTVVTGAGEVAVQGSVVRLAHREIEGWLRWQPEYLDSAAYEDVVEAIERFEPVDNAAGHMSARWLKEEALHDGKMTGTWLLYRNQKIQGFVSICSGNITLHDDGTANAFRRRLQGLPGIRYAGELVPASEIRWMGRHSKSDFKGEAILAHAVRIAHEVARLQGNAALVIDPYDDDTAEFLLTKFEFLRSAKKGQLWLRLPESA